jgi:hypothetical protein
MSGRKLGVLLAGVVAVSAVATAAAFAGDNDSGFKTSQPAMLTCPSCGEDVTPIITVGETLPGGYRFEAIPDGISLRARGQGRLDLYINHETSTVPFPFTWPGSANPASAQNDFDNAQVSHLILNQHSKGVLHGSLAITSAEGYQRFCSNYLATEKEGFDRPILFTNEEAIDWVKRTGKAFPATIGDAASREAGVVVAYDLKTGKQTPIWGMGRHNHENDVAIPGYDDLVVLSGDDPFVSNPQQSQLYSYIAEDTDALLNDEGDLWAFRSTTAGKNDYYDVTSVDVLTGEFVKVEDKEIATGRDALDGHDLLGSEKGFGPPPNDGTWQRNVFAPPPLNLEGIDGPQWVLESWSDQNDVFQFVRIEDVAYDKRPGMSNVVYLADSGRGSGAAPNGRIWEMVLDKNDPTKVTSLRILIQGDDNPLKSPGEIHQPDNLETTANGSLLIAEDPSSGNQFTPDETNATGARIWKYDLESGGDPVVVATVDQSTDGTPADQDDFANARLGAWEASGIVDASSVFGDGWFLVDVQAHSFWVDQAPGEDVFPPFDGNRDFTYKREGGQLLAINIPGA